MVFNKRRKVKVKEDIDIEEDLSNLQEIMIYELPKPLLPEKIQEEESKVGQQQVVLTHWKLILKLVNQFLKKKKNNFLKST